MSKVWFAQVQKSMLGAIAFSTLATLPNPSAAQSLPPSKDVIGQNVTSVSQLSDVRPTDWAFTALQSLVERYGCIAGYPDRTFRGKQATSRYEFAAGLNACLDKINEIISAGLADKVSKTDLATLQKLQEEFAAELATLRGRVDALDAKTTKLESQQFSTTTKLDGQVIASATFSGSGASNLLSPNGTTGASNNANATVISRVRLHFNTSFTGQDLLITRLEVGNGGTSVTNSFDGANGTFLGFTGFQNGSAYDYSAVPSTVSLGKLVYNFPISEDIQAAVGPVLILNDYLDKNSFSNDESVDFAGHLFINNPLTLPVNNGAGALLAWNINKSAFTIRAGYVAANGNSARANNTAPNGTINQGLFGDSYQGTFELEFAPKNGNDEKPFAVRLQYTRASVNNLDYNTGGVNFEWAFNKAIAIFGRYGFGNISNRGTAIANALPTYINAGVTSNSLSPQTWSAGFAFPDLFKEGAMAAIAIGQPFIESQVGNATQTNLDLFYRFPVSSNISITPDLQLIFNANNNSGNSTITVGTLRTVFTF
ncbi:iron uptake porin [Pseudanabaena sp. 'Roaring Creek']|uniref:iron uptake porin n=1 Tax=Pseudanabaena sp. 'Roaring Creek' TaxID=1681830 RepID=UPI0006D81B96|nr:iron uptake porin [Pseudanabaena sp. 'Roaring Creek']